MPTLLVLSMSLSGALALGDGDLQRAAQAGSESLQVGRNAPATDATRLPIVEWSLWSIHRYYVDPKRVAPQTLTLAALESRLAEASTCEFASLEAKQQEITAAADPMPPGPRRRTQARSPAPRSFARPFETRGSNVPATRTR